MTRFRKLGAKFNVSGDPKGDRDLIREWRFDNDTDGWRAANQISIDTGGGSLQVTATGEDPFMMANVQPPDGPMMLRFWAKAATPSVGQPIHRLVSAALWGVSRIPMAWTDRTTCPTLTSRLSTESVRMSL